MRVICLGVCGPVLMALLKEASTKRLLTYGEIEKRLSSFEYGMNDKSNRPPVQRQKHLHKGKIIGTASQKMLLFRLFPIIFNDIVNQLETIEIYVCLREIISLVFACPFRKSWLPYLRSLSMRYQCLMLHMLPHLVIPKVHFITDYANQIETKGPSIRHWCMRFESKHRVFKQWAVKSNNFKNILYTLSKRNQMLQCLLFSSPDYYSLTDKGHSLSERKWNTIPIHIQKLLEKYVKNFDQETNIMEYRRLRIDQVMFIQGSVFVDNLICEEEIPTFLYLTFIFRINDIWLLIVEQLQTVFFDELLFSYEVEHTKIFSIREPNTLIRILPKGLDIYEVKEKSYVNIFSRLTLNENAK